VTFWKSCLLGLRWGLGHAAGLALVCAVFFSARDKVRLDDVGDVTDKIVGASMILLGVLALVQLRRWQKKRALETQHLEDALGTAAEALDAHRVASIETGSSASEALKNKKTTTSPSTSDAFGVSVQPGSAAHARAHDLDLPHTHAHALRVVTDRSSDGNRSVQATASDRDASGEEKPNRELGSARGRWSGAVGFSHGVASPSGILSVLPAVVLDDASKSSGYLIAFFVASTAAMGAFAGLFGTLATFAAEKASRDSGRTFPGDEDEESRGGPGSRLRLASRRVSDAPVRVAMRLNLFAGISAIGIGIAWIALSWTGKLGDL
jgi:ABC-type nickel/cobalt efflux system permease component RcnA